MTSELKPGAVAGQTREGAARRPGGRRTAARIVATAYEMLQTGEYVNFSMRGIAERAGIRLGNLQYYFPKREDLIRALLDHVTEVYNRRYDRVLTDAPDSPAGRLEAVIRWNFEDVGAIETRHFFIQLWPLLGQADEYCGELLAELYAPQIVHLRERILEHAPGLSRQDAHRRAEIIAAMIEGFTVTAPASSDSADNLARLCELTVATAFRIAEALPEGETDR